MDSIKNCLSNQAREDFVPMSKCKKGFLYRIHSRNLSFGVYDGEGGFVGIRVKFGQSYLFTEFHWDRGAPYGTVKPLEEVCPLPSDIPCTERQVHEYGNSDYAVDPDTKIERPVLRRDLKTGEYQHGKRSGFVDEWAGTCIRLPDTLYPYLKSNALLFGWLKDKQKELL